MCASVSAPDNPITRKAGAWTYFTRPGIGKKFLLLFVALALIGLGNWVVVEQPLAAQRRRRARQCHRQPALAQPTD